MKKFNKMRNNGKKSEIVKKNVNKLKYNIFEEM